MEQPDLQWTYAGNRIWIPQTEETHDGVDAAALLNGDSGTGTISTKIAGPALISFWWKNGTQFQVGSETINYEGEGWQQVQTVAWSSLNTLTWHAGFFDQLQIEDLNQKPLKLWAFTHFPSGDVINDLDTILADDRDSDSFTNLMEWALNKNLDFPNKALAYKIIEVEGKNTWALPSRVRLNWEPTTFTWKAQPISMIGIK